MHMMILDGCWRSGRCWRLSKWFEERHSSGMWCLAGMIQVYERLATGRKIWGQSLLTLERRVTLEDERLMVNIREDRMSVFIRRV